jgi:paraquat-inducible protein A
VSGYPAGTAAAEGLACCHVCFGLAAASMQRCPLCRAVLHVRKPDSLQRTVALIITASLLYIPANVLPIMTTTELGQATASTILGGITLLIRHGSYLIAGIIFVASVLVPIGKLLALSWLCWSVSRGDETSHRERTLLYRATELVGKWSMTDVFVVAVLVSLIQLGGLMRVSAGTAAVAFGGVVIVTMLAAKSFDPRLIWDHASAGDE